MNEPLSKKEILGALTAGFWCVYSIFKFLAIMSGRNKGVIMTEGNEPQAAQQAAEPAKTEQKALGIKELQDVLAATNAIAIQLIANRKNGVLGDATAFVERLLTDTVFKQALMDAVNEIEKVPAEIADIDIEEAFQLGMYEIAQIKAIIAALKQ